MAEDQRVPTEGELSSMLADVDSKIAALEAEMRPLADRKKILLRKKLHRLDEIVRQRQEVATQLTALEELYPEDKDREVAELPLDGRVPHPVVEYGSKPYAGMKVWQAARESLREAGRLMPTAAIAERIIAGGKPVASPISSKVSSTLAQRNDVFFSDMRDNKKWWGLNEWKEKHGEE